MLPSASDVSRRTEKHVRGGLRGRGGGRTERDSRYQVEAEGVFFHWSAAAGPERAAMSQRKLTRQLRLWESAEGPAPSLTSPLSPVEQTRGHGGSALFRRMKLNRSIQERSRSSFCVYRYSSASKPLICNSACSSLTCHFLFIVFV